MTYDSNFSSLFLLFFNIFFVLHFSLLHIFIHIYCISFGNDKDNGFVLGRIIYIIFYTLEWYTVNFNKDKYNKI